MSLLDGGYGDWEINIVSPTIQQSARDNQQDKLIQKNADDNVVQQEEIDRNTSVNNIQEQQINILYEIIGQGPASGTTVLHTIDTNFKVEADSDITSYNISYETKYNNEAVTPYSCTITKYVNDGAGSVILDNTGVSGTTITSIITGNKEKYVIEAVPDSHIAIATKSEIIKYIYYVGSSSATTINSESIESMNKHVGSGSIFIANEDTVTGEYVWIALPDSVNILNVTSDGMTFVLNDEVQTITNSLGTFKCYRSNKLLSLANWEIIINVLE